MTDEERYIIKECRVMVIGTHDFTGYVVPELERIGFRDIQTDCTPAALVGLSLVNIIAEYGDNGESCLKHLKELKTSVICPFDFVRGAGAMVIMPGDDMEPLAQPDLRVWAAEYIPGYCAFWNMEGCDWLGEALPEIKAGVINESAQRLAAHICARIAANIAVGREVKHFPRFYLAESGELIANTYTPLSQ